MQPQDKIVNIFEERATRRAAEALRQVEAQGTPGALTEAEKLVLSTLREHPTGEGARAAVRLLESGVRDIGALASAIVRAECAPENPADIKSLASRLRALLLRRRSGEEEPLALPWSRANAGLDGGYKPGVHYLIGATGTGKTQATLSAVLAAARAGVPCLCVGLELGPLAVLQRIAALAAGLPWSTLDHGSSSSEQWERFSSALDDVSDLPIYFQDRTPEGVTASDIRARLKRLLEEHYPETHTGPRPSFVVVDFLQLVAPEGGARSDPRERVGKCAYAFRFMAEEEGSVVLVVCSTSREGQKALGGGIKGLPQGVTLLPSGGLRGASALASLGKEAGEIEYSADTVTTAFSIDRDESGERLAFCVSKHRAGRPFWYPLVFNGTSHREPTEAELEALEATIDQGEPKPKKRKPTDQETEVLRLLVSGMSRAQVGERLGLSKRKVQTIAEKAERGAVSREALNGSTEQAPNRTEPTEPPGLPRSSPLAVKPQQSRGEPSNRTEPNRPGSGQGEALNGTIEQGAKRSSDDGAALSGVVRTGEPNRTEPGSVRGKAEGLLSEKSNDSASNHIEPNHRTDTAKKSNDSASNRRTEPNPP